MRDWESLVRVGVGIRGGDGGGRDLLLLQKQKSGFTSKLYVKVFQEL